MLNKQIFISFIFFALFSFHTAWGVVDLKKNTFNDQESSEYLYFVSIGTIFKDEAPYLKEWIEYHKLMGVEHFRLYNNDSTDNYLDVLEPYIQSGEVTVIDWLGVNSQWCETIQGPAMLDAISYFRGISKWLAIIDIDEFILPTQSPDLISFLQDYDSFASVVINWLNYGTSWVNALPSNKLMIETLTWRAHEQTDWNSQVKSIVQPKYIDTTQLAWTPHLWSCLPGKVAVAPNQQEFVWGPIDVSKIRINHYVHRTESYFYTQKIAKKERMEHRPSLDYLMNWLSSCNQVEDKSIFKHVPALREIIFYQE